MVGSFSPSFCCWSHASFTSLLPAKSLLSIQSSCYSFRIRPFSFQKRVSFQKGMSNGVTFRTKLIEWLPIFTTIKSKLLSMAFKGFCNLALLPISLSSLFPFPALHTLTPTSSQVSPKALGGCFHTFTMTYSNWLFSVCLSFDHFFFLKDSNCTLYLYPRTYQSLAQSLLSA